MIRWFENVLWNHTREWRVVNAILYDPMGLVWISPFCSRTALMFNNALFYAYCSECAQIKFEYYKILRIRNLRRLLGKNINLFYLLVVKSRIIFTISALHYLS